MTIGCDEYSIGVKTKEERGLVHYELIWESGIEYIELTNDNPKPFFGIATTKIILAKVKSVNESLDAPP